MPETIAARVDFAAFIELAKTAQRDLNAKSVDDLNRMLADDRTGMVMAALEQRARFEDDARTQTTDEWTIGMLTAQAEWALPRNGEPSAVVVCHRCRRVICICG